MTNESRLNEIASYLFGLGQISNSAINSRFSCYAGILRSIAKSGLSESDPEFASSKGRLEHSDKAREALRQTVKQLTETSEKLRALNREAVAKTLRQSDRIKKLEVENHPITRCRYVRGLEKEVLDLKKTIEDIEGSRELLRGRYEAACRTIAERIAVNANLIVENQKLRVNARVRESDAEAARRIAETRDILHTIADQLGKNTCIELQITSRC